MRKSKNEEDIELNEQQTKIEHQHHTKKKQNEKKKKTMMMK